VSLICVIDSPSLRIYLLKYYTGIGSKDTPQAELARMEKIGSFLGDLGYVLRTGDAVGAERAFEQGALNTKALVQKWRSDTSYFPLPEWATEKASEVCWEKPLERMKAFQISRVTQRVFQVFGDSVDIQHPVDFVVYWSLSDPLSPLTDSEGDLRYTVRVAHKAGIPTYNLRSQREAFAHLLLSLKDA